jgi:fucose 4-O-acetylase-like acetyltransferase
MTMASTGRRIAWIDTARGLGLLAVFIGHLRIPFASSWVYTFHMPLFFFLSGLLYPGCEKYTFTQFAWRRFKGLVIPYFTLGAVIALFYCCVYAWHHEPASSYFEMFQSLLIQKHYWTIWFLAALFLTQLIYYGLDWCFHRWKYAVSIASVIVCLFGLLRYRLGWGSLPWNLDVAFVAQFFFHLGYRFMKMDKVRDWFVGGLPVRRLVCILLVCLFINIVAAKSCIIFSGHSLDMSIGMYGNELMTMISAIAGILFIVTLAAVTHSRFVTYLGCNTMILFAWHSRIVIVACDMVYAYLGLFQQSGRATDFIRGVVTLIVILIVLVPVNEAIKRLPCHKAFGV